MNLREYNFDFGVFFRPGPEVKRDYPGEYVSIPANIGRILFRIKEFGPTEPTIYEAINCTDLFPNVNMDLTSMA